jgi:predicted O-methyltransferase YrrM
LPFVYKGTGEFSSIRPKQVVSEIGKLFAIIEELQPKYVCEIGTFKGGTLYLWCEAARRDAVLVAVDYLIGPILHPFSLRRRWFYQNFKKDACQTIHCLAGDSHRRETFDTVKRSLLNEKLDFLFIDGDHSYKGVKRDFELYLPLVREGGIIAFHDILPREECPEIQVYKFWQEIKRQYDSQELVANIDEDSQRIGIGVVRVGSRIEKV